MKSKFPGRKDSIILTAIEIINDSGIQNLSTKELARRQDITESLLYRHFKSKDEIIVAVLEYYSKFDQVIRNTILRSELTSKGKITEFFRMYTEYYENYPAITSILLSYHQLLNDPNTSDRIRDIFSKRNSFLLHLVTLCREGCEISDIFTSEEVTDILFGFSREMLLKWRTAGYSYSLKDCTLATLEKILKKL